MQPVQQMQQPVADLITKYNTMTEQNKPFLYRLLPSKKTFLEGVDLALFCTLFSTTVITLAAISCPEKEAMRIHYPWCRTGNVVISLGGASVAVVLATVRVVADRICK